MSFPRLPIEKFDENGLYQAFYVNRFSQHLHQYHSDIDHPHKHDFYLTVFFTKGKGKHDIDFKSYPIETGSVFFLQPEQIHHWEFEEEPEGWIFFHSSDFYKLHSTQAELLSWPFFRSQESNPMLQLDTKASAVLDNRFSEIADEYHLANSFSFLKIGALVQLIYADLARIYQTIHPETTFAKNLYNDHFNRFEQLLEQSFTEFHSPTYYANELSMTTKHLHRVCQSVTGKSTSQLIAERIILEAKRKLISEGKSLAQIAEELGFENYPYFNLFFKKHCGETPKNFRQKFL